MSFAEVMIKSVKRSSLSGISKIIIAAAVIIYLYTSLDLHALYNSAKDINIFLLSSAVILLPVNILLQFYKWKLSCNYFLDENDNKRIWQSLFAGFSAGIFTPARIGEYVGRGLAFRDKSIRDITVAVFMDKLFTLTLVVLSGFTGSLVLFSSEVLLNSAPALLIILLIILVGRKYIINKISRIRMPDHAFLSRMITLSSLFYFCYLVQFILLISALTNSNNLILFFSAASVIMLVKTMIPNFLSGEFGIRESASVFFFAYIGEDPSAGFNASLLLFIINIVIPSVIGLYPLLRKKYE
jgi:uncharacterized membrane protein YbhN (UPF0104 family)